MDGPLKESQMRMCPKLLSSRDTLTFFQVHKNFKFENDVASLVDKQNEKKKIPE